jgi:hypothetical protein
MSERCGYERDTPGCLPVVMAVFLLSTWCSVRRVERKLDEIKQQPSVSPHPQAKEGAE